MSYGSGYQGSSRDCQALPYVRKCRGQPNEGSLAIFRHSVYCCHWHPASLLDAHHHFPLMFSYASPCLVHLNVVPIRLSEGSGGFSNISGWSCFNSPHHFVFVDHQGLLNLNGTYKSCSLHQEAILPCCPKVGTALTIDSAKGSREALSRNQGFGSSLPGGEGELAPCYEYTTPVNNHRSLQSPIGSRLSAPL